MRPRHWGAVAALVLAAAACHAEQPRAQVVGVRPSARQVPANLLRISVEFAAPVEGPVLSRLTLAHADEAIRDPFLPQELWSPSGRILTVLMHPARVKTGLKARARLGPILAAGDEVTLALDGRPIKQWSVVAADTSGPLVSDWQLSKVRVASRQALVVGLDAPVDGRAADYLAVVDSRAHRVAGHAELKNGETTWAFTPDRPWRAGEYKLVVRGALEDPAGNRLGGSFESPIGTPLNAADAAVSFAIDAPAVSRDACRAERRRSKAMACPAKDEH